MTIRVALAALTTTGAAGEYVAALTAALARRSTVAAWIPSRPPLTISSESRLIHKGGSRPRVAVDEATAWLHRNSLATDLANWRPDVVHIVFGEGYPTAARTSAALKRAGIAVAVTWHDPISHGQLFDHVQHFVAARTSAAASGVHIHCNELTPRDLHRKLLVAELPAFPCPSCPDATTTQPVRTDGTITMVGRFAPYKGVDQLCAALTECWRQKADRPLVVVGQGRIPTSLLRLREQWPARVTVHNGYVSGERLHDVLRASAICVMPYLNGTQSALPWLARLHGTHIVATDVGCIGSTVRHIGGRIVAPGSVEELTDALLEPPSTWSDVPRLPLPTFDALAERLVEWYSTLSAR